MCGFIGEYTELNKREILMVVKNSPYGFLGSKNESDIEVVPMYFVSCFKDCKLVIYMMITGYGNSMENMESNSAMTLTIPKIVNMKSQNIFNTVVIKGNYSKVSSIYEKEYIRNLFYEKYFNKNKVLKSFDSTEIYYIKMNISEITGRAYYK